MAQKQPTEAITIRPVRLTNAEYADLKRKAQLAETSVAGYVEYLIRTDLQSEGKR